MLFAKNDQERINKCAKNVDRKERWPCCQEGRKWLILCHLVINNQIVKYRKT